MNHSGDLSGEFFKLIANQQLLATRTVFISEAVSSHTAKRVVTELLLLDTREEAPIYIYVNSPGGEVTSGLAMYDTIRYLRSPVTIINTGLCASIATIINIAVPKERRCSMPNTRFLLHQPAIHGQIIGPAADIEITATQIINTRSHLNMMLAQACGQSFHKVESDTSRDYWMNSEEALAYGLIGRIVTNARELTRN